MLFAGTAGQPLQIMRVTLVPAAAGPVTVRVMGAGVRTPQPLRIDAAEGASQLLEVPVAVAAPHRNLQQLARSLGGIDSQRLRRADPRSHHPHLSLIHI